MDVNDVADDDDEAMDVVDDAVHRGGPFILRATSRAREVNF